MSPPLISVILPVYNASPFADESIKSILAQTFGDFELLIIDDGSTDDSFQKISAHRDDRIRILQNEKNEGLIATLNKGIQSARGKYIARMDADDVSAPERFARQAEFLEKNPRVGITGSFIQELGQERIYRHRYLENAFIKPSFLFTNPIAHPSVMVRKEILAAHPYEADFIHGEDYALWVRLLPVTEFHVIPLPLLSHRTHDSQVSLLHFEKQRSSVKKAQEIIFGYLGITAGEPEKEIHFSLFREKYNHKKGWADEVEKWLLKLKAGNEKTNFFDPGPFNSIIGECWFKVNQELARTNHSGYRKFKSSVLSRGYQPAFKSMMRLLLRSI